MVNEEINQIIKEKQIVVFDLGNEEFGVNISQVREIIKLEEITKIPNTENYIDGMINLRGKIIVIIDLERKLGLSKSERNKDTRIIVIEVGNNNIGMIVDSCNEVLRLSIDNIKEAPNIITHKINTNYIEGVGVLDKRLILLLDLAKILSRDELKQVEKIGSDIKKNSLKENIKEESKTPPQSSGV